MENRKKINEEKKDINKKVTFIKMKIQNKIKLIINVL